MPPSFCLELKMKYIDALNNVDRSRDNSSWINSELFAQALGIYGHLGSPDDFDDRMKSYWLVKWYCTDTWVGTRAVFFDDELIGSIEQVGRKYPEEVKFISKEVAQKLREYLLAATMVDFSIIDSDMEINDTYTVAYGSQLLVDNAIYDGRPVTIVDSSIKRNYNDIDKWHMVTVRDADGNEFEVDVEVLFIPIHTQENSK
jgi:hypothetical protein